MSSIPSMTSTSKLLRNEPHCRDLPARLRAELELRGRDAAVAALPEGPMTIPYLQ
jgi:hypothetical protein